MGFPRGPILLLLGVIAGVVVGERSGGDPAGAELLAGVVVAVIVLVDVAQRGAADDSVTRARRRGRLVAGVVALVLLASAFMQRALNGLEHSGLTERVAAYSSDVVWVTLTEDPGGPTRFVVEAIGRVDGRTVLVIGRGDAGGRLRILSAGDRVRLRGSFQPLSGWDTRERWRHAVGAFEATDLLAVAGPSSPLTRLANRLRSLVLAGTNLAPPAERGLLAGLLLGDTRSIPRSTVEEFRASGLTHHLAVSGENVAFVLALVGPLLRRLGYRGRFVFGLAVIVVFGTMTRWEPSVLRAVAMAGIAMCAGFLGRPASGLRLLVLAAGGLLLADPFLLHSVGFALSCGATVGIAVLSAPIAARLPGPDALRDPFAVTLAAQIGVAPVLIPVFGELPLASLPANVLAAPLMAPITIGGLLAGTIGGVARSHAPGLSALLLAPVVLLVQALQGIAAATSHLPFDIDTRGAFVVASVGGVVIGCGLVARASARRSAGRLDRVRSRRARSPHP